MTTAAEQTKIIHSHAADALASAITAGAQGTSMPNRRKPHGKARNHGDYDVFDVNAPGPAGEAQPQLQVTQRC